MKKLDTCTTIVLYDLEAATVNFEGLFKFLENWFLTQGYTPLRGSADGEGITATKTWTFKHTKKTLEKRDFQNLTGFWFAAYPPQWGYDMTDGLIAAELDVEKRGHFSLYFHHDVLPFDPKIVEDLIKDISQYVTSRYGIVYQRDFDKGPGLYAVGIITGLDRYNSPPEVGLEMDKISKWLHNYISNDPYYHLGLLRDIYPMNLLSETHLQQSVFNSTLKDWIESSSDHGELKKLTDILWEWWVPESQISTVREALKPTGLLLCA